jgi:DNA-binding winged helix-turn-helix (wHTH) protein
MGDTLPHFYDFGPFRIDQRQHLLLRYGKEVALTPKASDTLLVLVRNHGQVVEKDELLKSVWPDAFVEEATLAQNIFTLRKTLARSESSGARYIETIPKRGYRFAASVIEVGDEDTNIEVEQVGTARQSTRNIKTVASDTAIRSLAVLPMINGSGDPSTEYLSDGITESVVNILSLLPEFQVKACSTIARFKGREVNPQEVGRELGVGAVMWGRVLPFEENVIIRIELVDVASGWQLWGEQYNERLSNIFKVQEEIAKHISES